MGELSVIPFGNVNYFSLALIRFLPSLLQVFTTAAYDDHKNIVLLAFEIIEKIIRDYFPYITETETTTFTDCVNCLVAFTNSRFNKDISLNAIAFLRFCATKLAQGDLASGARNKDKDASVRTSPPSPQTGKDGKEDNVEMPDKDDNLYFWFPLLAGKDCTLVFFILKSIYLCLTIGFVCYSMFNLLSAIQS